MALPLLLLPHGIWGAIVVNEVLYDPTGIDTGKEFIELYNNGGATGNLSGWQLNTVSGDYYTIPQFSLEPGGFVVIHWRADGTDIQTNLYTGTADFGANMGNTSGFAVLFSSSDHTKDTIVDYMEYGAGGETWESTASSAGIWMRGTFVTDAGEGYAIGLASDGADTNAPPDWTAFENPTPGMPNAASPSAPTPSPTPEPTPTPTPEPTASPVPSVEPSPTPTPSAFSTPTPTPAPPSTPSPTPVPLPRIHINEFYPNTAGSDADEEWIELWNEESRAADISGWKIDDGETGSPPYTLKPGSIVAAGEYLVLHRKTTGIALNNEGDTVRIFTPGGQMYESVAYEKAPQGASSNRTANGSYAWSRTITPGSANILAALNAESSLPQAASETPPEQATMPQPQGVAGTEPDIQPRTATTASVLAGRTRNSANPENGEMRSVTAGPYGAKVVDALAESEDGFRGYLVPYIAALGAAAAVLAYRLRRKKNHTKERNP